MAAGIVMNGTEYLVPPNRWIGIKLIAPATVLMGFCAAMAPRAISRGSLVLWALTIGAGLFGLILTIGGLMALNRRRPVIAAGPGGLVISVMGSDQSTLTWEQVTGFEVVGKGAGRMLAVTVLDVDEAWKTVHSALRGAAKTLNARHSLKGAVYVSTVLLRGKIDEIIGRLRQVAVVNIERGEASDGRSQDDRR